MDDFDSPLEKEDFVRIARTTRASRDVGSQLFCALLRSIGVEARLVCSLQPLPLTFAPARETAPERAAAATPFVTGAGEKEGDNSVGTEVYKPKGKSYSQVRDAPKAESPKPLAPRIARRLGNPTFREENARPTTTPPASKAPRTKRVKDSPYPVYWVEAFDTAGQKWIPADPITTGTVRRAAKLEPPWSDPANVMTYVFAFEKDGAARDVTRRYAKAFNAKTRTMRVEATPGGDLWFRKVVQRLSRAFLLDRDQVEDAELAAREAQEPMPRSVALFKNHPYYVLERHLRKNEVIHPRTEVGKLATGKATTGREPKRVEPVFRRRNVHRLRSANGWYRLGQDVKPGEQPLKHSVRRKTGRAANHDDEMNGDGLFGDDDDDDGEAGGAETGLYAAFQTTPYEPPPVVNGRVPKNAYGNIDLYVPSMLPKGAVHLSYAEAARAARLLAVDYADAVTGFEFKGRHGTAVLRGVVTAAEHQEAIEATIQAMQDEAVQAEASRRSADALRMWRRFLAALRVRERIGGYEIEGGADADAGRAESGELYRGARPAPDVDDENADTGYADAGGFFPDRNASSIAQPTAGFFRPGQGNEGDDDEGVHGGGFVVEDERAGTGGGGGGGGGFMADDDEEAMREAEDGLDDERGGRRSGYRSAMHDSSADGSRDFDADVAEAVNITRRGGGGRGGRKRREEAGRGVLLEPETRKSSRNGDAELAKVDRVRRPHSSLLHDLPPRPTSAASVAAAAAAAAAASAAAETRIRPPLSYQQQPQPQPRPRPPNAQDKSKKNKDKDDADPRADADPDPKPDEQDAREDTSEDEDDEDDGDDDRDSLLSHDPDDDDADPEWLL
ncbi:MAG: hypothetical protein M1826_006219 [Phylliscum demangeonii]|nr:MAG: hypothetical protein M1826_006219 [Phylliscum demangeonii]